MSYTAIFDKIIEEKRKEGEKLLKEYEGKAEEYTLTKKAEIDREIEQEEAKAKKMIREKYTQMLSAVKIEERGKLHNKKYKIIKDVFDSFMSEQLLEDNYIKNFTTLLKKYGKDEDIIIINHKEIEIFKNKIIPNSGHSISISEKELNERGFLIDRGIYDINCTFAQFVRKLQENSDILLKILFG